MTTAELEELAWEDMAIENLPSSDGHLLVDDMNYELHRLCQLVLEPGRADSCALTIKLSIEALDEASVSVSGRVKANDPPIVGDGVTATVSPDGMIAFSKKQQQRLPNLSAIEGGKVSKHPSSEDDPSAEEKPKKKQRKKAKKKEG